MRDIEELPGLEEKAIALLHGAGLKTVEKFIASDAVEILERLKAVGMRLEEEIRPPSQNLIEAWQTTGRELLEKEVRLSGREAVEVSPESLEKAGVAISSLPVGKVFELESSIEPGAQIEHSRVWKRKIEGHELVGEPAPGVRQKAGESFRSLGGNQKVEPRRERRNRGMPHPKAGFVRWAAAATVAVTLLGILSLVGLITVGIMAFGFGFQPSPRIAFAFLPFPIALMLYLLLGIRARCQFCGQKCFVSKNCQKHEYAVRSILGFGFAAARDALLFSSFRCMYCGSKNRLKG
ncbi:MAG TPA: hypothetical protein DIV39_01460 [Verrucomicrobiales bacterium]|nr:hypothetical protein [Verrucomicrobiales bacterium]